MLEFVFTQMTHTYAQSFDKSNTFMILTNKNITWEQSIKFWDTIFKNNFFFFEFLKIGSKFFYLIIAEQEKEFLKKLCLVLKKEMY